MLFRAPYVPEDVTDAQIAYDRATGSVEYALRELRDAESELQRAEEFLSKANETYAACERNLQIARLTVTALEKAHPELVTEVSEDAGTDPV